jgi:hypothetical protein
MVSKIAGTSSDEKTYLLTEREINPRFFWRPAFKSKCDYSRKELQAAAF